MMTGKKEWVWLLSMTLLLGKKSIPSKNKVTAWTEKTLKLIWDLNPACSGRNTLVYHLRHHHGPRVIHFKAISRVINVNEFDESESSLRTNSSSFNSLQLKALHLEPSFPLQAQSEADTIRRLWKGKKGRLQTNFTSLRLFGWWGKFRLELDMNLGSGSEARVQNWAHAT